MENTIIIKHKATNKEYMFNTKKSLNISFNKIRKRVVAFVYITIKNLDDTDINSYSVNITGHTKKKNYSFSI